jgi:26S proteasome regulatory subunit N10
MEDEQNRLERQRKEREEKEKESKSQLEGIPEEGQPLLDQNGEASGSKQPTVEDEKEDDDPGKMDTS